MKITADTTIEEIVRNHPELVGVLEREGIVCLACGEPVWGTLGEQVEKKGLDINRILTVIEDALGGSDRGGET